MISTPTVSLDSAKMWRLLIAATHPDTERGSHELCIFVQALKEYVLSKPHEEVFAPSPPRPEPAPTADPDRVPFLPDADFRVLTRRAVMLADDVPLPYRYVLRLLRDCEYLTGFEDKQRRGASYKQLAAIGHNVGMSKQQRVRWYGIAEAVPLADRHASHLLGRLKRRAA